MHVRPTVALASLALCALTAARGAELSADCRPVMAAMEKSLLADHAAISTHGSSTSHGITVDGAVYLQVGGAWRKSPWTAQSVIAQSRENLKDATSYTCKALPDSVVDGAPVTNYLARTVSDDATVDTTVAIAKATGLVVSVDNRQAGASAAGTPEDIVTRYTYGKIKAPI